MTLTGILLAASPLGGSSSPARAADDPVRVSLIGDSTMAAIGWYPYDNEDADTIYNNDIREIVGNSYDLVYSAESCRRLVNPSCTGRFGYAPRSVLPLMQTTLEGQLGEALVIMAGYDDVSIASAVDAVVAEAESQGVVRVVWLTYRTGTGYVLPGGTPARTLYEQHNAELTAATARHPNLRLLDWNGYSAGQAAWFASDGIHLTREGAVVLATYIKTALDEQPIGRCRASSALAGEALDGAGQPAPPSTDRTGFVALAPKRVLDTRDSNIGGGKGKLGVGRTVTISLDGQLPRGTRTAVLSVTAVEACRDGYLTVFACGPRPPTSSINYEVGRTTAGVALSALTDRKVCIFSSQATDLVVDLTGAFTTDGQPFHPLTPARWVDTRGGPALLPQITGARSTGADIQIPVRGQGGVPGEATGVWLNLTIAEATAPTVLLAYPGPCGSPPLASTVNARATRNAAAGALVGVGSDGSVCIRTVSGSAHVVVDVAGWFGQGADGLAYQPRTPARVLDTRATSASPVQSEQAIGVSSVAVLNVAATETAASGYITARPCGTSATSSLLNNMPGESTANLTAVGPGGSGSVCVLASVPSHLVVDQVGVFVR